MKIFHSFQHLRSGGVGAKTVRLTNAQKRMIMRLNFTIITIAFFCLQAIAGRSTAQNVTVNAKGASLKTVLQDIGKQSRYQLFYDSKTLEKAKPVNIQLKNIPLKEALQQIFDKQPLKFEIIDNTIAITEKNTASSPTEMQQNITGKVTNERGDPLPGVTVTVKGTNRQTATDSKGYFSINANSDQVLVFSFLGYTTVERNVVTSNNVNITLSESVGDLDQVQIQGYGVTTQRLSTGNIGTVNAKTIAQQTVTNPLQAITGRIAGVQVTQVNSLPGSPVTIQIRGLNSLGASNRPLFIIDDVAFNADPVTVSNSGALTSFDPLNVLNPNDIESISVLKDADATAIYGSRGANGVVLITTKKGSFDKTKVDVGFKRGFNTITNKVKPMATSDYLQMRKAAFVNAGTTPSATTAPDLLTWDQNLDNRMVDWYAGNTADLYDANASFSGGNATTQFLISGNFHQEGTVISNDNNYRRGNLHFSIRHASTDNKFKIDFTGIFGSDYSKLQNTLSGSMSAITFSVPNYPYYTSNGSYNWVASQTNFYSVANAYTKSQNQNLNLNVKTSYAFTQKLMLSLSMGTGSLINESVQAIPSTAKDPASSPNLGNNNFNNTTSKNYIIEPLIKYEEELFGGKIQALLGSTIQKSSTRFDRLSMNNYLNDLLIESRNGGSLQNASTVKGQYNFLSIFSRINYNYKNRYIANATFRRDGSGRFGPNNRFGNFGSIGASWLFINETFLKNKLSWLSHGKLRGSYGTTGSDGIGDFAYLSLYTSSSDYGTQRTLYPSQIANPDYKWEVTKKLELALDLGFFKDRILISSVWYRNRSGNQLVTYPLPTSTGFSGYIANLPAIVQNSGWEFELNTNNINKLNFTWNTSFNLTIPENKLLAFPGIEQTSFANTHVVGKPIRSYLAYQFTGIDPNTGIATVADLDGNGVISANSFYNGRGGDKLYVGTANPKWFAGMNNSVQYKNLQLDVFLQYTKQLGYNLYSNIGSFGTMQNSYDLFTDYWKAPGDITATPKPFAVASTATGLARYAQSDRALGDASFLRVKSVNLTYSLPQKFSNRIKLSNAQVYFQAQNLFTITDYKGSDPEMAPVAAVQLASLRTISFGLRTTF